MISKSSLKNIKSSYRILELQQDFAYLLPCEQLRSLISNFTITFPDDSTISNTYTILPHGSVTLVLFNYKTQLHSFLFGPTTKPVQVGDLANQCEVIFIVEFQPAGFFPFTKINQQELTDKIVPFSTLHYPLDQACREIFSTSTTVDTLLLEIEKKLIESIQQSYPDTLVLAIRTIIEKEGTLTSTEISENTFYSTRQINRLFNLYLGMSMKAFSKLVRINKSIQLLNDNAETLESISEKLDYYDVSHFVKDFKMICGITPHEYKTKMSDFYSEIAKY